jgi:translation initiation factor 2 subunit 3
LRRRKRRKKVSKLKSKTKDLDPKMVPEVNIGMVGHVAHGKTTLTEAITGKSTLTHSEELKRGITIRLGYADATFYKCKNNHYCASKKCPVCFSDCEILRSVSFIDAPGHETLMTTVLSGASLMDGAVLIIAANEKCPQPQTREHLTALEVVGIKNVVIVQNKIDLVTEEQAMKNYKEIKQFVKGTILENAPIVPVSAQQRVGIDIFIETIETYIKTPERETEKDLKMLVARSFDINKPGTEIKKLVGGVLGGSIIVGNLTVNSDIEIRPLITKVIGLQKAGIDLEEAGPGGLLGVMTTLDPLLTKSDTLVGNIVSMPGKLPEPANEIIIEIKLMERIVGSEELKSVAPIKVNEDILINAGTARSIGTITSIKKDKIDLKLKMPLCIEKKERVAISRQIGGRWRLIGYGAVV